MTLWCNIFIAFNGVMMLLALHSENLHSLVFHGFIFIGTILVSLSDKKEIKVFLRG